MNNGEFLLSEAIGVIREVLDSGGEFRLYPKGRSMLPLLKEKRDSVVLKKYETPDSVRKNDIVFYQRTGGQFVLHRVIEAEADGTYTMCGDHQLALEHGISFEQMIGVVVKIYKKDKPLPLTAIRYRLYEAVWCRISIRRFLMLPRRLFGKLRRTLTKRR